MATVKEKLKLLGREELARRLNVGMSTIGMASSDNEFRASWYPIVQKLAAEKGVTVPDNLFGWKKPVEPAEPHEAAE